MPTPANSSFQMDLFDEFRESMLAQLAQLQRRLATRTEDSNAQVEPEGESTLKVTRSKNGLSTEPVAVTPSKEPVTPSGLGDLAGPNPIPSGQARSLVGDNEPLEIDGAALERADCMEDSRPDSSVIEARKRSQLSEERKSASERHSHPPRAGSRHSFQRFAASFSNPPRLSQLAADALKPHTIKEMLIDQALENEAKRSSQQSGANETTASVGLDSHASSDLVAIKTGPNFKVSFLEMPANENENEYQSESDGNQGARRAIVRKGTGPLQNSMDTVIIKGRGKYSELISGIMDSPDSSTCARMYGISINLITVSSVVVALSQTLRHPWVDGLGAAAAEVSFEVVFLLELIVRCLVAPRRCALLQIVHNYFDFFAILPLFVRAAVGFEIDPDDERGIIKLLLCIVPILRMLKILRRFQKFLLLWRAFALAAEALPVLLYTLTFIALMFSSLIYLVEPRDNIPHLPDAWWLTIVTMTTVGYGDSVPKSGPGHIIVTMLIVTSALYMAMPLGIVGAAFTNVWKQRDCILLVKRTRDQMDQLGYTAYDIPLLFKLFDSDKDGELSRGDFVKMIEAMNVNLPTERVIALFDTFDVDGGGSISDLEFIRQVFPKHFQEFFLEEDENAKEGGMMDHMESESNVF